jgi:hypothetical protein
MEANAALGLKVKVKRKARGRSAASRKIARKQVREPFASASSNAALSGQ